MAETQSGPTRPGSGEQDPTKFTSPDTGGTPEPQPTAEPASGDANEGIDWEARQGKPIDWGERNGSNNTTAPTPPDAPETPAQVAAAPDIDIQIPARPQRRGLLSRFFSNRRGGSPELQREEFNSRNPGRLAEAMTEMTARDWRERKLNEKYKGDGLIAEIQKFAASERSFTMDEDGNIRRDAWAELRRIAGVSVFNKQTMIAAGTAGLVGFFTGGVGAPAAFAIYGAIAGRGAVETWRSMCGKTRGLREEIAKEEALEFGALQEKAKLASREDLAQSVRNQNISEVINGYYNINQRVIDKQKEILGEDSIWNRRAELAGYIGSAAGLGLGINALLHGGLAMDINGAREAHKIIHPGHVVKFFHNNLVFAYNSAQEAAKAVGAHAQVLRGVGQYGGHVLGESTRTVLQHAAPALLRTGAQVGAVFMGMYLGALRQRKEDEGAIGKFDKDLANRQGNLNSERDATLGHHGSGQEAHTTRGQAEWQGAFQAEGKPLPEAKQIWASNNAAAYRIESIDYDMGKVVVTILNPNLTPALDENGQQFPMVMEDLSELLRVANRREELTANYMSQFTGKNDRIIVDKASPDLVDRNGRPISGEYTLVKNDANPNEVFLKRANEASIVISPFMLALFGFNRVEPAQGQEETERKRAPRPQLNVRYEVTKRDQLPEALANLPDNFVVSKIDDDQNAIDIYDFAQRSSIDTIPLDLWDKLYPLITRRGSTSGGGGNNKRQGRGRQGGEQ